MNAIETFDLAKNYGETHALQSLNLRVERGELFGFIGPNGAGKSTTIRLIMSLIYPTSGYIKILGKDISKDGKGMRQKIGYVPSEVQYYDRMTVLELLNFSSGFYRKSNKTLIKKYSEMFDLDLKKDVADLSTGNRKKVAIVQSLIHEPEILILDEPTSGLDPLIQDVFYSILRELNQNGTTIFFSSHILTEVQKVCKKVAIIREGKLVKVENIETLRQRALKKVLMTFKDKSEADNIELNGYFQLLSKEKHRVKAFYSGKIEELIELLSKKRLSDLEIIEPSLEEIFMHYYKK